MRYAMLLILVVSCLLACGEPAVETPAPMSSDGSSLLVWGYVDDGCQLLPGAKVKWHCDTCAVDLGKAVADGNGIYSIYGDNPPNHLYHHVVGEASAEGYETAVIEYTSWPGCPSLVSFTLESSKSESEPAKVESSDAVSFYGHVSSPFTGGVPNAAIELQCQCGNYGPVYSNSNGDYVLSGCSHEGHNAIIYCGATGYLATGLTLDPCGPAPEEINFSLYPAP